MSRIFLSHSSHDNVITAQVDQCLAEQEYHSVFLDFHPEQGIPSGRRWEREIYNKLRNYQGVILLCSEHSMTSAWFFAEITHARALGKDIFLIIVSPCKVIDLLMDRQMIDLGALDADQSYQRLWRGPKSVGLDPNNLYRQAVASEGTPLDRLEVQAGAVKYRNYIPKGKLWQLLAKTASSGCGSLI